MITDLQMDVQQIPSLASVSEEGKEEEAKETNVSKNDDSKTSSKY